MSAGSFPGRHDDCRISHPHTHAGSQPGPTPDDTFGLARRLEYYFDGSEHRWRLIDNRNGKIVGASHEGYADRRDARHNAVTTLSHGLALDAYAAEGEPPVAEPDDGGFLERPALPWALGFRRRCRARLTADDDTTPNAFYGRCELVRGHADDGVIEHALERGMVVVRWQATMRWDGP